MPIRHLVFPCEGLLYGVGTGSISNHDVRVAAVRVLADPMFRVSLNELWDFRGCAPDDVSFGGLFAVVRSAVAFVAPLRRGNRIEARCAVVVETEEQFGFGRMFQSLSEQLGLETEVFRDWNAGARWLGLNEDWRPHGLAADRL